MAEPESEPNARLMRRFAVGTYVPPILAFLIGLAFFFFYWRGSPPPPDKDLVRGAEPQAQGTAGTEGERRRADETPGGHNPDPKPSSANQEIESRGGRIMTELGEVFEEESRGTIGRRVELRDITVERVESGTLFWIRDGNARIAVSAPTGSPAIRAGQSVDVVGTVERSGNAVRIRASRVEVSQ